MLIEFKKDKRLKQITLMEYSQDERNELNNFINSFECVFTWYISKHSDGNSMLIFNIGKAINLSGVPDVYEFNDFYNLKDIKRKQGE